jgi:hypothetical protein
VGDAGQFETELKARTEFKPGQVNENRAAARVEHYLPGDDSAHAATQSRHAPVTGLCTVAARSAQLSGAWLTAARGGQPDFLMG